MPLNCLMILAALLSLGDFCRAAAADVLSKSGYVEIQAEPLVDALNQLADQIDVDIPYDLGRCSEFTTSGISGIFTVRQALDKLLRGTGLQYEVVDARGVKVVPPTPEAVARLLPVGAKTLDLCGIPDSLPPTQVAKPVEMKASDAPVVITGTNVSYGVKADAPLVTYPEVTLEQLGYDTLSDFFNHFPRNLSSNSRATYGIGDGHNIEHGTSVNLLGLGEQATLVLIDGHRVAASALGDFVDISLIPASAVERVEILTGGDAAIYGADAVAGVINIILRKNFSGVETSVRYSAPYDSDASELAITATMGTTWKSGNIVSSVTFGEDRPLLGTDRSYSNAPGFDLTPAVRDYNGFVHFTQELQSRLSMSVDGLYAKRYTTDDIRYVQDGAQVGPYSQYGVTDQYTFAPILNYALTPRWQILADFDLAGSRFREVTTNGPDANPSGAIYKTLSEARVRTADLRLNGSTPGLPGGDATLAIGVGGRREDYDSSGTVTAALAPGSFVRHVAAVYGELHVPAIGKENALPFLQQLEFSLAVRAERYSDVGNSVNPKVGFAWQPTDTLHIHGTYGTSFSAPRYTDTLMEYNSLVIQRFTTTLCASGSCLVAEEFGANTHYQPERSRSFDLGLDWTPGAPLGLQVRSNAYLINYRDQIGTPPGIPTVISRASAFPTFVVSDPSRAYMTTVLSRGTGYPQGIVNLAGTYDPGSFDFYVDDRIRNLTQTVATGIDLDIDYEFQGPYGTWTLGAAATRVLKLEDRASPVSPPISMADTFAHPVSRHYESHLRLHAQHIDLNVRLNYVGRYSNDQVSPPAPIAKWTTLDAAFMVPLEPLLPSLGKGSRLQLTLSNLTNRKPPYAGSPLVPLGYDPVNANAMGRVIGIRIVTRW